MKLTFTISLLFLLGISFQSNLFSQSIRLIPERSSVTFNIKNWGLTVDGRFGGLEVTGNWDENAPSKSKIQGIVKSTTVDANIDARNASLRGEEYFHVEKFPEIKITSTSIERKDGSYTFKGKLEMKGMVKNIEFPFNVSGTNDALKFTGEFKINRLDYQVGTSSMVTGDIVTVFLECTVKIVN